MRASFIFHFLIFIALTCFFPCCSPKEPLYFDGFSRNSGGLYYKMTFIGDGKDKVGFWDKLNFSCNFKKQNDSVFFSSLSEIKTFFPADTLNKKLFHCRLGELCEGDSMAFLMKTADFFKCYFQGQVPEYCRFDSLVKIEIRVNGVEDGASLTAKNPGLAEELKEMLAYVQKKNMSGVKELSNSVFIIGHEAGFGNETVCEGKSVTVEYKGYFLNDSLIDNPLYSLQFVYGTPDQLVEGLNYVIKGMRKGETKKIILPSHLAYGEKGSSNGTVPPFTPLLYNIKILEVK